MAASSCGPLTIICVFVLLLIAASLALARIQDKTDLTHDLADDLAGDLALSRGMRSVTGRRGSRRGNERIAVDSAENSGRSGRGGRRRGRNRDGSGRGERRRNQRRRGGSRPLFRPRERNLIGRLSAASSQFALTMYNALKVDNPEVVFSPHSIHTALTMAYMGAGSRTARQMMRVLGLSQQRLRNDKAHLAYAALSRSLTSTGNVTLNAANAVYVKPNLPVEQAFRQGLQTNYLAQFDHIDLGAEGGAEAPINRWVANITQNKIQSLLSRGTITPATAMVIINAIYFKGKWKDPFLLDSTTQQNFYKNPDTTVRVPMMARTGSYKCTLSQELNAHVVELPYQGDRFSMMLLVPEQRFGLSDLQGRLSVNALNNAVQALRSQRVALSLPRFKSSNNFSLKDVLRSIGMVIPFTGRADFSGICSTQDLFISDVIHEAVVEVNEEGTEAAAATGVLVSLTSLRIENRPIAVRADHPYLYAIRDTLTNTWLFVGHYSAQQ